jgi:hypothetical protein
MYSHPSKKSTERESVQRYGMLESHVSCASLGKIHSGILYTLGIVLDIFVCRYRVSGLIVPRCLVLHRGNSALVVWNAFFWISLLVLTPCTCTQRIHKHRPLHATCACHRVVGIFAHVIGAKRRAPVRGQGPSH